MIQVISVHADGQKIAKKLSVGITRETKRVKQLLVEYNGVCDELHHQQFATLSDVLLPSSDFWTSTTIFDHGESSQVPFKVRREIVQHFLLLKRSEEEKQLLSADMYATMTYWLRRIECISKQMSNISSAVDQFSRGATCLLQQLKWSAELQLRSAVEAFNGLIELPAIVVERYRYLSDCDSVSDESSDNSSESDSDFEDDYSY